MNDNKLNPYPQDLNQQELTPGIPNESYTYPASPRFTEIIPTAPQFEPSAPTYQPSAPSAPQFEPSAPSAPAFTSTPPIIEMFRPQGIPPMYNPNIANVNQIMSIIIQMREVLHRLRHEHPEDIGQIQFIQNLLAEQIRSIGWSTPYHYLPQLVRDNAFFFVNNSFIDHFIRKDFMQPPVVGPLKYVQHRPKDIYTSIEDLLPPWIKTQRDSIKIKYAYLIRNLADYIISDNKLMLPSQCPINGPYINRIFKDQRLNRDTMTYQQIIEADEQALWFHKLESMNASYAINRGVGNPTDISIGKTLLNFSDNIDVNASIIDRQVSLLLNIDWITNDIRYIDPILMYRIIELIEMKIMNLPEYNYDPTTNQFDARPDGVYTWINGLEDRTVPCIIHRANLYNAYGATPLLADISARNSLYDDTIFNDLGLGGDATDPFSSIRPISFIGTRNSTYENDKVITYGMIELLNSIGSLIERIINTGPNTEGRDNAIRYLNLTPQEITDMNTLRPDYIQPNVKINIIGYYHSDTIDQRVLQALPRQLDLNERITAQTFASEVIVKTNGFLSHSPDSEIKTTICVYSPSIPDFIEQPGITQGTTYRRHYGGNNKNPEINKFYNDIFNTTKHDATYENNSELLLASVDIYTHLLDNMCDDAILYLKNKVQIKTPNRKTHSLRLKNNSTFKTAKTSQKPYNSNTKHTTNRNTKNRKTQSNRYMSNFGRTNRNTKTKKKRRTRYTTQVGRTNRTQVAI